MGPEIWPNRLLEVQKRRIPALGQRTLRDVLQGPEGEGLEGQEGEEVTIQELIDRLEMIRNSFGYDVPVRVDLNNPHDEWVDWREPDPQPVKESCGTMEEKLIVEL